MNSPSPRTPNDPSGILPLSAEKNAASPEVLFPEFYEDLRRLAAQRVASLMPGQTLQATAVVHEAWLRLAASNSKNWTSRTHFFATAAEVMRYVLIDHIRGKVRLKRGGGQIRLDIDDVEISTADPDEKVLLINEAIEKLQAEDPKKARVVVLKFFGGLTDREIAESLNVTERTIERHWAYAKAWLFRHIQEQSTH